MVSGGNPLLDVDAAELPSFESVDGIRTKIVPLPSQPLDGMGRLGKHQIFSKDPAGGLYRSISDQRTRNRGDRCEGRSSKTVIVVCVHVLSCQWRLKWAMDTKGGGQR